MLLHQALAHFFRSEGVTDSFGLMGTTTMDFWTSMQRLGANMHSARHEGPAVTMAHGWTLATGNPGVACITRGPAVTQIGTALTVAVKSNVPLVVFAGDSMSGDESEDQYLDQPRFIEATGAGIVMLRTAARADRAVHEAFRRARAESRPIVLDVPVQLIRTAFDGDVEAYRPSTASVAPAQPTRPSPEAIARAADVIAKASRPVIVLGLGARSPEATEAAIRLGDQIGALLGTTLPNKSGLQSPWSLGVVGGYASKPAQALLKAADVVIGVGASLTSHTIGRGKLFPDATIIQLDIRSPYLTGTGRLADVFVQGDARFAVEAISAAIPSDGRDRTGFRQVDVREVLADLDADPVEYEIEPGRVDPRAAMRTIEEHLPAEVGYVSGIGHQAGFTIPRLRKHRPFAQAITGFGCIGNGFPAAIGAATALRPAPLMAVEGDAGAIMHLAELDTVSRLGLKLLLVVMNDEGLGAEYWKFASRGEEPSPASIPSPDLGAVSRACGGDGRVARTVEDVAAGVRDFMAGDGLYVLDVRVSRRVPSISARRNYFGE